MALTAKQEAFCQAIVSGMSQADAYRSAYDAGRMKAETVQNKAHVLMKNGEVRVRVEALRAPVVEELRYDLKTAMKEAMEAYEVAKDRGNGGAMVAATTLRAKLYGLLVERKEVRTGPLDDLGYDELKRLNDAIGAAGKTDEPSALDAGSTRH